MAGRKVSQIFVRGMLYLLCRVTDWHQEPYLPPYHRRVHQAQLSIKAVKKEDTDALTA